MTIGDFATTRVRGPFRLAYLVDNAITSLTTQDEQVECFRNAAAHMEPGGCFVIEVVVPQLRLLPPGQNVVPIRVSATGWGYVVYDAATQESTANHVRITDGGGEHISFPGRYVWPAELDLMARLAGMTLRERWSNWEREPFHQGQQDPLVLDRPKPSGPSRGAVAWSTSEGGGTQRAARRTLER